MSSSLATHTSGASYDRDAELLSAYARGDREAAKTLMARLAPRLLAMTTRMLGDAAEAEDITQEALLRLWKRAPEWDAEGGALVSTWVTRVALNLATDRLRRRRSVGLDDAFGPDGEPHDGRRSVEKELQVTERAAALRAAMARLPERQAQAVALRHLEGLSNPEIADLMGTGIEAVESLTARGRRTLKTLMAEQYEALSLEDGDD